MKRRLKNREIKKKKDKQIKVVQGTPCRGVLKYITNFHQTS